jgi:hypothetical protein
MSRPVRNVSSQIGLASLLAASLLATSIAYADEKPAAAFVGKSVAPASMDFRAPEITKLYSAAELERLMSLLPEEDIENVDVEGTRPEDAVIIRSPIAWGGLAAPVWAFLNPTEAWRILAPLPPDQARYVGAEKPDATATFLPVTTTLP